MKLHRLVRGLAAILLLLSVAPAQNLVPNPSFETFTQCPNGPAQMNRCVAWDTPTLGSPEYCHACSFSPWCDVPNNAWGSQTAHTGSAYVGYIFYNSTSGTLREYVEAQLTSPLQPGATYQVSFWVSLGDKSKWQLSNIGAHLSVGPHGPINNAQPIPVTPQIQNPTTNIISDATNWTQISGSFVAAGGEDHIVIGNFVSNASTNRQFRTSGTVAYAIYYVDDVSVVRTSGPGGPIAATRRLIGWSDLPSPASTGFVDMQDVDGNCQPAFTRCTTQVPVRAANSYAGGTAYDPRYQTVWVSDGDVLAEYRLDPTTPCKPRCTPFKAVKADPNAKVSGLACSDRRPRLFQLATRPGYMEITIYDNSTKCPSSPKICKRTLPGEAVAGGLAYDEARDLLYISVSQKGPAGWVSFFFVTRASNPCVPICENKFYTCSGLPITGLAYDACDSSLFATDGQVTQRFLMADPARCQYKVGGCCKKQLAPSYRGLAVVPGWKRTSSGSPCAAAPCPSCPSMSATTTGDPSIGSTFQLALEGAPSGAISLLFLKFGACSISLQLPPPFCGSWYVLPILAQFPPVVASGPPPCGGVATHGLPLPPNPSLCGVALCAQWFIVCPTPTGFGVGLSQAIGFTITGS